MSLETTARPPSPQEPRLPQLPPALKLYGVLVAALLIATAVYLAWALYAGVPLLYARLWSAGPDRFGDFWHYHVLFRDLHRAAFFSSRERFAYPAPCAVLYALLYAPPTHQQLFFELFLSGVEIASGLLLLRAWLREGLSWKPAAGLILLTGLGSHPWHMLFDRANIELFVYIFVASGVWAFLLGRHRLAASLWGAAAALKLYPILLLVVFLRRKNRSSLLIGVATSVAILLLSFWYVGPTVHIAAAGTLRGIHGFTQNYGGQARKEELFFDHSLLASLKQFATINSASRRTPQDWLQRFYFVVVLLLLPWLYLRWFRHLPDLNQICILLCLMVLLPPVSYDYTLIHTYLAFGILSTMYLRASRFGYPVHKAGWLFACFAVLTTPQTWMRWGTLDPNGLFKCAALLTIIFLLLRHPLQIVTANQDGRGVLIA